MLSRVPRAELISWTESSCAVEREQTQMPMSKSAVLAKEPAVNSCPAPNRLAYLLSRYPAVSHTFLLNEIRTLRSLNFEIATASINSCDRPSSALSEIERTEEHATFYVKRAGASGVLIALADALVHHPLGLLRGLYFVIRLGGCGLRFFYYLEALLIGKWMRERGLSHLHAHFGGAVSTVAMIAARTFPLSVSFTIHGPDEFYDVRKYYLAQKIETASFVCCIGSFARSQLMMLSPTDQWNKLLVSRLGVDSAKLVPSRRNKTRGPIELICVGRLVSAKGHFILLAAFRRLVSEGRNVRLRLVGDGPERQNLTASVARAGLEALVVFEGAVNADRVRTLLESADIFVLPSFAEGIPIALMEAMSMEVPCVSTSITGIPELIRSETDGILVPPADEEQLAAALSRLIDDAELRERLGRAGRRRVEGKFHLSRNVTQLAEIFQCRL